MRRSNSFQIYNRIYNKTKAKKAFSRIYHNMYNLKMIILKVVDNFSHRIEIMNQILMSPKTNNMKVIIKCLIFSKKKLKLDL